MTIALVSPGLLPVPPVLGGSVETVMQQMAGAVKGQDFCIYGPEDPALPKEEADGRIRYVRFPAGQGYFKRVRSHLSQERFDVVQVENRPLFIGRTKPGEVTGKFILSLHSLIHIHEKLLPVGRTQEIFDRCDKILVYSAYMQNELAQRFPEAGARFTHIHLGTDPRRFRPRWDPDVAAGAASAKRALNIPPDAKIILFAGRLIPKKGVDILLKAAKEVLRLHPDCFLVIVGNHWFGTSEPTPYVQKLHRLARSITRNVRFTNYLEPDRLPLYFAMADVLVCPSQWEEPFGLVNVEAMASGVPVVASAVGGIPEIVRNEHNGFLVSNEKNPASFIKPLRTLLENRGLACQFGRNGRRAVEDYFNWDRAGRQLAELYAELGIRQENSIGL